jgi:hypothetical protein
VIIQDLEPYGGEDAAIVQWAHAIQSRLDCEQEAICSDSQLRKARQ